MAFWSDGGQIFPHISVAKACGSPCLITVTTIPGVCAWVCHPSCALTIDGCSAPVRHLSRITWHPPSVRINAIISPKQNRVITPIFNKLFTVWRDSSETRKLRQIRPCVMNVTWVTTSTWPRGTNSRLSYDKNLMLNLCTERALTPVSGCVTKSVPFAYWNLQRTLLVLFPNTVPLKKMMLNNKNWHKYCLKHYAPTSAVQRLIFMLYRNISTSPVCGNLADCCHHKYPQTWAV